MRVEQHATRHCQVRKVGCVNIVSKIKALSNYEQ